MFFNPIAPLVTREELDLEQALTTLIESLSRSGTIKSHEAHVLLKEFRENLERRKTIDIHPHIRGDLPRRKVHLEQFFAAIAESSRKCILRSIALYDWASKIDEYINQINSTEKAINEKVISLIKQIFMQNLNTSVTNRRLVPMNLRKKDDIFSSDGFVSQTVGAVSAKFNSTIVQSKKVIKTDRPVYLQNIYREYSEEKVDTLKVSEKRYDFSEEPIVITLMVEAEEPFSVVDIGLNVPFVVKGVYSTEEGGRKESIDKDVLGEYLQVNGVIALERTRDSFLDANSINTFSFILPVPKSKLEISLEIQAFDTYPLRLYELHSSSGELVRKFTLLESMIIDKRIMGAEHNSLREELEKVIATGILKEKNEPSPFRVFTVTKCNTYRADQPTKSVTAFNPFQSDLKIRTVEIYVDAYDPMQTIEYMVEGADGKKLPISPVNSNPKHPTKIVYEQNLPRVIHIESTIQPNETYLPILFGMVMIIGEVNI